MADVLATTLLAACLGACLGAASRGVTGAGHPDVAHAMGPLATEAGRRCLGLLLRGEHGLNATVLVRAGSGAGKPRTSGCD